MKHGTFRKTVAVLAALALLPCLLIFPSSAEVTQHNMAEIVGIDYDRITQKAGGGQKSYPVECKLGDVSFTGELYGDFGLSYDELNAIIRRTLQEKNLTTERVALVAKIAERVQTDAKLYWGEQVMEGLLSYLNIPGLPVSVADYYAYIVHGETDPAALSATINAAKAGTARTLAAAAKTTGRVGKVAKGVLNAVDQVPMLGEITNTALVAQSWTDGNKRFENYLKLLEQNLETINDFYAACSRKAVDLAEQKGEQNVWKIRFDKARNYRTYPCTFWGIQNNMMSCTLSGELTNSGTQPDGAYAGTLTLTFEAVDLSPTEKNLERTPGLTTFYNVLHSMGAYRKVSDTGGATVLRRTVQGELTLYVTETRGTVRPETAGSLTSAADRTTFSFSRKIQWRDDSMASYGAVGITDATFTSEDVREVAMSSSSRVEQKGKVATQKDSNEVFAQPPGTVFAPLDSAPVITIRFSN